jgi:hypothetical protein
MSQSSPAGATGAPHGAAEGGPLRGRRRRIVIDARYQLRSGLFAGAITLVLLALLNASLVLERGAASAAAAGAGPASLAIDRGTSILAVVGSALFLAGVVLVGVLESHRTAGAAYAIRRVLDALREGQSGERVRLRRNDHLKELGDAVNRLADSIDDERRARG